MDTVTALAILLGITIVCAAVGAEVMFFRLTRFLVGAVVSKMGGGPK